MSWNSISKGNISPIKRSSMRTSSRAQSSSSFIRTIDIDVPAYNAKESRLFPLTETKWNVKEEEDPFFVPLKKDLSKNFEEKKQKPVRVGYFYFLSDQIHNRIKECGDLIDNYKNGKVAKRTKKSLDMTRIRTQRKTK